MEFLYLGKQEHKVSAIKQILSRSTIHFQATDTPEAAYFKILRDNVAVAFLEVADLGADAWDVASIILSLERDVELVLISTPESLSQCPESTLRTCFGRLDPNMAYPGNIMVLHQLTEKLSLKSKVATLKTSAIMDGLTELHNHAYIQQQLDEEIRLLRSDLEPLTLVMLDIDHFKHYNDTNGHPAGDSVLKKVARLLEKSVRKFDYTARYGGEEFVMALPSCTLEAGLPIAGRLRHLITQADFEFGKNQPMGFLSASIGVAVFDYDVINSKTDLFKRADQALYKAKEAGRNQVWFYRQQGFHLFRPG